MWNRYLITVRERFGAESKEYIELTENFIKEFANSVEVKNDKRVVKRFIEYAKSQNNPLLVYDYMNENGIGKSPYFLYYTMARKFEKEGQYYSVLDAFKEGLKINEAINPLLEDLAQFKNRMKKRIDSEIGKKSETKSTRAKRKHIDRLDNIEQELTEM